MSNYKIYTVIGLIVVIFAINWNPFSNNSSASELTGESNEIKKLRDNFLGAPHKLILSRQNLTELTSKQFEADSNSTEIYLDYNEIVTIDGVTFQYLSELKILDLSHNKLNDLPPKLFLNNHNLEIIDLSHNFIATINDWREIPNLQYLNLNFNQIYNISMSDVSRIQNISLNNNQLKHLKTNEFVQVLHADHNQLTNENLFINDSVSLIELSLSNNLLMSFDFIQNLINLSYLNLTDNPVNYNNRSKLFSNLTKLKRLILKTTNIRNMKLEHLSDLRELEMLDISECRLPTIDFTWIRFLKKLKYFNISGNNLEIITIDELEFLFYNLILVLISDNYWGCRDLKQMQKRLKDLKLVMYPSEKVYTTTDIRGIECTNETENIIRAEKSVKITLEPYDMCNNNQVSSGTRLSFDITIIEQMKTNLIKIEEYQDHIRQLKFINSQMSYIPHGIFDNFGCLEYADFSNCQLEVMAPSNFSNAFHLRELILSHNNLSKLENNVFDGANNLIKLNLAYNKITIIESETFKYLITLTNLDLSHNQIKFLPSDLFINTPNIKVIDLSNNLIETINHWDEFNNLQYLNLNFNRIHNISIVGSIRIQNISLNNNQLKHLKTNEFVQVLHADNNQLTNADLFINDSVILTELSLSSNSLMSFDFIQNLTNVSYLNLTDNPVKYDNQSKLFSNLKNLKSLILKLTNLSQMNFEQFSDLQKLETLDFSTNGQVMINFEWLEFIEYLRYLNMKCNILGNMTYDELKQLYPNLKSVAISNNNQLFIGYRQRCDLKQFSLLVLLFLYFNH